MIIVSQLVLFLIENVAFDDSYHTKIIYLQYYNNHVMVEEEHECSVEN